METISFELTKTEKFHELKPFGKFTIKWTTKQGHLPRIIPFSEIRFDSRNTMSTTDKQDKEIIKFMKKHKTDILTDGYRFYTRIGEGFGEIYHIKLHKYIDDPVFKMRVDFNQH
jgi:hypothetical protein